MDKPKELPCSKGGRPPCQGRIKEGDMVKTTPKYTKRAGIFAGRVTWIGHSVRAVKVTLPDDTVKNVFIRDLQLDCGGMCAMLSNPLGDLGHNITRIKTAGTILRIIDRAGNSEVPKNALTGALKLHHPTMILEDVNRELMTLAQSRAIVIDGLNESGSHKGNIFIKRGPNLTDVVAMIDTYLADDSHDNKVVVEKGTACGPTTLS